jgi:Tannase-like family of unknown function (DUF6351)
MQLGTFAAACAASMVGLALLAGDTQARSERPGGPHRALEIEALSTRPWLVSGGDVLLEIRVPPGIRAQRVQVLLNGIEVSDAFRPLRPGKRRHPGQRVLRGLVSGLDLGSNSLIVTAEGHGGKDLDGTLELTNWPLSGPIISGPHEQPFFCQTEEFEVAGGVLGETLGPALDENCSIETRVDYLYKSTDGTLKVLEDPSGPPPADLAETTTIEGKNVPYIVRLETGSINRAVYEIAFLHEPGTPLPDPFTRAGSWNGRMIYRQGGGCRGGWYVQGADTGGVLIDEMLARGYATVGASLNVYGNNCNDPVSSETTMMVKEHFVEEFGPPRFTIGWGSSGGSYQSHQTSDNYPGLFDGIVVGRSFPEVAFATVNLLSDARLLKHYFDAANAEGAVSWTEEEQRAVSGFGVFESIANMDEGAARIDPVPGRPDRLSAEFDDVVAEEARYDPVSNPGGARATVYDHAVNGYGRDPGSGFARRPLDNVGIQYGLAALNAGQITPAQFLDLNEKIGGFDIDANFIPERTETDLLATRLAYRGGRLTNGGGGLAQTPIIDFRNYTDLVEGGDIHMRFHSFSTRERLINANGHADNQVIVVAGPDSGCGFGSEFTCDNPPVWQSLDHMDRWLRNIGRDHRKIPLAQKVVDDKPADALDACWTPDEPSERIVEEQTYDGPGECNDLYPSFPSPRIVAGGPLSSDVIKCTLKPIDPDDYEVALTAEETGRLHDIFPDGVCDWSEPGIEQQPLAGTWLSLGPSPINQIFDVATGEEFEVEPEP